MSMEHIPPNIHPNRLQYHLKACSAKATTILKSTQDGAVLTPEAATAAIGELAALVVTLAQATTACAYAVDKASNQASSGRGRHGLPTW